jgi:zinc protease
MDDDPGAVGSQALNRLIYRGSPLAEPVLGAAESLEQMRADDLRDFHASKYGPQNTILIVAGDTKLERTIEIVLENFSGWSNPDLCLRKPPEVQRQSEPLLELKPMPKEQSTIFIGHLGVERSNQDFYALQVVDTILGGGPGFTSRIPRELRDNLGLAYSAYSDLTGSSGIYPGRFAAYVCTSPENRDNAQRGLLLEIAKLRDQGVSDEELSIAKEFLTGSFVFEFQGNASIARYMLSGELFQLEEDYPNRYAEMIRAVTGSEAHRVARRYLDTVNYSTVIAGSV